MNNLNRKPLFVRWRGKEIAGFSKTGWPYDKLFTRLGMKFPYLATA